MDTELEAKTVLELWNSFFTIDPTTLGQLNRKFFKNQYCEKIDPILHEKAFSLICRRSKPFLNERFDADTAWILSAGGESEHAISEIVHEQIKIANGLGIRKINYSGFSPGYFFPGVDKDTYPSLFQALLSQGFVVESEALMMEADIGNLSFIRESDSRVSVTDLADDEREEFLSMVYRNFPADCYLRCKGVTEHGSLEQITVARVDGNMVGYAMFASGEGPFEFAPGERFGCFEVIQGYRSLGIGSKLLNHTLVKMKANGIRHAYFLWTTEKASHIYSRFGFKITRRFQVMSRTI